MLDGQGFFIYKEFCFLVSDFSQLDLVYKFMNLVNYYVMWNFRKGVVFGFNVIVIRVGEQLVFFLFQLVF